LFSTTDVDCQDIPFIDSIVDSALLRDQNGKPLSWFFDWA